MSSISISRAQEFTFKQHVSGEFLKLQGDNWGSKSRSVTLKLLSHKVVTLLFKLKRYELVQSWLVSVCVFARGGWRRVYLVVMLVVHWCRGYLRRRRQQSKDGDLSLIHPASLSDNKLLLHLTGAEQRMVTAATCCFNWYHIIKSQSWFGNVQLC